MKIELGGIPFDNLTEAEVVDSVFESLAANEGGRILTPNVDVLRQLHRSPDIALATESSLVVPDGMPIVWASRIQRTPLPERVTGASLVWSLSERAEACGASVFLLGGAPGVAEQAADAFRAKYPRLDIAGTHCPPSGFEDDPALVGELTDALARTQPDVVFVALGHPRQDAVGSALLRLFPRTWFLGCGGALTMAADIIPRAPKWVGAMGLEWLYRFGHEPTRLFKRYFVHDMPFAARLMMWSYGHRLRGSARTIEVAARPPAVATPFPQQRQPSRESLTQRGR